MSLKNAAALAFAGSLALALLLTRDFVHAAVAATRDLIPVLSVLRPLVYLFASVAAAVFLYVFHRTQNR
jgi:hypothetical protein